jgi:signal transduction histidine kinase
MNDDINQEPISILRQKAEEVLNLKKGKPISDFSESEMLKLIFELEVHQIELEMQNEELKATKLKAEINEEKYINLFEFAPIGYITLSSSGIINDLNFCAANIIEFERFYLKEKKFSNFISSDSKQIFEMFLANVFNTDTKLDCEITLNPKSAKSKIVYIEAKVLDRHNECLLNLVDITKRKESELDLVRLNSELYDSKSIIENNLLFKNSLLDKITQSENKLKEAIDSKDKFFSIISHDLRSPLSGFIGMTQIMSDEFLKISLRELNDFSIKLHSSAKNLYDLLNNLLEWSKMQRNMTEYEPEELNITEVLNQNIENFVFAANQKNITIINLIKNNYVVFLDKQMISSIFRNLISNAIKFTKNGGLIEIGICFNSDLEHMVNSDQICMYIKDNGIGMNKNILNNLFKIDEKVTRKGTNNEDSTGLGLILIKEFVNKLGGEIWVESEVEKGSTFYFSFNK